MRVRPPGLRRNDAHPARPSHTSAQSRSSVFFDLGWGVRRPRPAGSGLFTRVCVLKAFDEDAELTYRNVGVDSAFRR
jgi:hypothetical protein